MALGLLAIVVITGFLLRAAYYRDDYGHPDEKIAIEVVRQMGESGSWDTNWVHARLPPEWKVNQYNFSSYLVAARLFHGALHLVPVLQDWSGALDGYWALRFFSVLLGTLAVWQTWRLGCRVGGVASGLGAAALAALVPLLVQDAHYARPEAWVTVLTLLAVELVVTSPGSRQRAFGAAVVIGLLVACKVSFVLLAWLPLLALPSGSRGSLRDGLASAGPCAGGALAGFALGAPFAVVQPAAFLEGVQQLHAQYSGIQPPYSNAAGGMVAGMLGRYFAATLGWPMLVAGLLGASALVREKRWRELAAVAGPVVVFAGFFATRSVFFERNLSHVAPLGCILAGCGAVALGRRLAPAAPVRSGAIVAALIAIAGLIPAEITSRLLCFGFPASVRREEAFRRDRMRAGQPAAAWAQVAPLDESPLAVVAQHFAAGGPPLLLEVSDTGDPWSTAFAVRLQQRFEVARLGEFRGRFSDLPFSTLNVYLSPNRTYYLVRGARPVP